MARIGIWFIWLLLLFGISDCDFFWPFRFDHSACRNLSLSRLHVPQPWRGQVDGQVVRYRHRYRYRYR